MTNENINSFQSQRTLSITIIIFFLVLLIFQIFFVLSEYRIISILKDLIEYTNSNEYLEKDKSYEYDNEEPDEENSLEQENVVPIVYTYTKSDGYVESVNQTNLEENYNELDTLENLNRDISPGYMIVNLTIIVLFLIWFNTTFKNLIPLGVREFKYSSKLSVISFIIPFVSLFLPFMISKEIWFGSKIGFEYKSSNKYHAPTFIFIWWILFILSDRLDMMFLKTMIKNPTSLEGFVDLYQFLLVTNIIGIFSILATIYFIKEVFKLQENRYYEILNNVLPIHDVKDEENNIQ